MVRGLEKECEFKAFLLGLQKLTRIDCWKFKGKEVVLINVAGCATYSTSRNYRGGSQSVYMPYAMTSR